MFQSALIYKYPRLAAILSRSIVFTACEHAGAVDYHGLLSVVPLRTETPDSEREIQEGPGCLSIASCALLTRDTGIAGSLAMDNQQFLYLY